MTNLPATITEIHELFDELMLESIINLRLHHSQLNKLNARFYYFDKLLESAQEFDGERDPGRTMVTKPPFEAGEKFPNF